MRKKLYNTLFIPFYPSFSEVLVHGRLSFQNNFFKIFFQIPLECNFQCATNIHTTHFNASQLLGADKKTKISINNFKVAYFFQYGHAKWEYGIIYKEFKELFDIQYISV